MQQRFRARHAAAIMLWMALASDRAAEATTLGLQPVVSGLTSPVALVSARDGSNRLFIVDQSGIIRIYDGTGVLATPFLDITTKVLFGGERGLLGLAFDASYGSNRFFYVFYTSRPSGTVTIARYTATADPNVADPDSEVVLQTQAHASFGNHNGGGLAFGPDGCLYAGIGDGGGGGDPQNNGQNLATLLGKIVRIDPSDGTACAGNPFIGTAGARDEIWALGLRNPWRITFDRETGQLFIADVGQSSREEVNVQPPGAAGRNYCWRRKEGTQVFDGSVACTAGAPTDPVLEYSHAGGECSITGGYRYRGSKYPSLAGTYLYADFCSGRIWGATENGGGWTTTLLLDTALNISSFGEDEAGEIYVVHLAATTGAISRLVAGVGVCEAITRLGDSSGDGRADLAWRSNTGEVAAWLLDDMAVSATASLGTVDIGWRLVGVGDLSGDGRADYVWRHASGAVAVWFMNGATVASTSEFATVATDWQIIGVADATGDGRADLLWRHNAGAVAIWVMNGSTVSSTSVLGTVVAEWRVIAVGDVDGDGKADLVWRHDSGVLAVWLLNGGSVISTAYLGGAVDASWRVVAIGDFDADSRQDLVWRHDSGTLGIWFLNGTSPPATAVVAPVDTDWHVVGAGDVSADGRADLVWRHDSGLVAFLLMNGASVTTSGLYGSAPAAWQIIGGGHDPVRSIEGPCSG